MSCHDVGQSTQSNDSHRPTLTQQLRRRIHPQTPANRHQHPVTMATSALLWTPAGLLLNQQSSAVRMSRWTWPVRDLWTLRAISQTYTVTHTHTAISGQLSLPSLQSRKIEYQPYWLGLRWGVLLCLLMSRLQVKLYDTILWWDPVVLRWISHEELDQL